MESRYYESVRTLVDLLFSSYCFYVFQEIPLNEEPPGKSTVNDH